MRSSKCVIPFAISDFRRKLEHNAVADTECCLLGKQRNLTKIIVAQLAKRSCTARAKSTDDADDTEFI